MQRKNEGMSLTKLIRLLLISLLGLSLLGCDVVKLDKDGNPIIPMSAEEAASLKNLTPKALADKFWSRIMREAETTSKPIGNMSSTDKVSEFIRIEGIVKSVDDSKITGTMTVAANNHNVVLKIGPVILGNAIRDATSFIKFSDFKNQVQFARLSKALNKKAMKNFTRPDASWVGSKVDILAAATYRNTTLAEAIPLEINRR
jgi:predicted lipoprotein